MASRPDEAADPRDVDVSAAQLEELEELFHYTPVGLCLVDLDCCYVRANQTYAEIVGYELDDLTGRRMHDVIPESARDGAVASAQRVMQTGEPLCDIELRRFSVDPSGDERVWLVNIHPVRRHGEVTGSVAVLQNITSVRRAEEMARQRLEELESVYRNAPVGLSFVDRGLRYLRANQVIADLNGVSVEGVVGKTYRELSPETADAAEPLLRALMERGEPVRNLEVKARPPADPELEHTFLLSMDPVRSEAGEIIGHTSAIQDVTELRRSQQIATRRLEELEILYAHTPVGLCFMDPELRVIHLNPLFGQLSPRPLDEQPGAAVAELIPEAIASQLLPQLRYVVRSGASSVNVQVRGCPPGAGSREYTWLADAHPLKSTDGAVTGVISVLRDITTLAERRRELEATRDRLAEAQNMARVGSWEWNILEGTIWWSPQMYKIFGENLGLLPTFLDVVDNVHPEDRQKFRAQIERTLADDRPYRETFRVIRPDGSVGVIFAAARLERTAEGQPARMIGTSQEVTDFAWIDRETSENGGIR